MASSVERLIRRLNEVEGNYKKTVQLLRNALKENEELRSVIKQQSGENTSEIHTKKKSSTTTRHGLGRTSNEALSKLKSKLRSRGGQGSGAKARREKQFAKKKKSGTTNKKLRKRIRKLTPTELELRRMKRNAAAAARRQRNKLISPKIRSKAPKDHHRSRGEYLTQVKSTFIDRFINRLHFKYPNWDTSKDAELRRLLESLDWEQLDEELQMELHQLRRMYYESNGLSTLEGVTISADAIYKYIEKYFSQTQS